MGQTYLDGLTNKCLKLTFEAVLRMVPQLHYLGGLLPVGIQPGSLFTWIFLRT